MRMRFSDQKDEAIKRVGINMRESVILSILLIAMSGLAPAQDASKAGAAGSLPYAAVLKDIMAAAPAGYIGEIQAQKDKEDLVVVVRTSTRLAYQEFRLDNPSRLVVDFLNAENRAPVSSLPIHADAVSRVRVRQFQDSDPKVARLVVDISDSQLGHQIQAGEDSLRIVFPGAIKAPKPAAQAAKAPENSPASAQPAQAEHVQPVADKTESGGTQAGETREPASPVISDLGMAEIPQSSLAAAPQSRPAPPGSTPVALAEAVPTPAPPVPSAPPLTLTASRDSRFAGQPLTLDLVNISLVDFFRLMSEEGGVNIVMDPEIKGTLSIKVVQVPWDQIFEAALANNGLDRKAEGNLIRIATKSTLQNEARQEEALKKANLLAADLETRIKRLNYAKAKDFVEPLKDQITVRGTVVVDERANALIITDLPSSLEKVVRMVETLDTPQPQVEIEARIVSATRDFARDIGVQFGFVQGNLQRVTVGGPNTFGTIGGTRPSATPKNTYAAGNPVTGRGASESTSTESAGVSTGNVLNDRGNFNVNLPAQKAFGGLGLSVGNIFDTFLLDAAITAGESKGLAKLISQPKVTAQNNSEATITQGLRFPVQVIANNTVTVQFQNAALTLVVTPQITYDGNVVLDLKVENNTPDFARQVQGIPSIRTSESQTRVLVTDGGTTVIGGILIDNEQNQKEGIPGLSSLPVVGYLFQRNLTSRSTQEVLFFITPRIVK